MSRSYAHRFPVPPWRYRSLARTAEWRLGDFNVQDLANTAWAFATANQPDTQLFAALARTAEWHLGDFNMQGLANTAWAFATTSQSDGHLLEALVRAAEQCMSEFDTA